jgi:hypothetical protein
VSPLRPAPRATGRDRPSNGLAPPPTRGRGAGGPAKARTSCAG